MARFTVVANDLWVHSTRDFLTVPTISELRRLGELATTTAVGDGFEHGQRQHTDTHASEELRAVDPVIDLGMELVVPVMGQP